jgi:hypothetical protein
MTRSVLSSTGDGPTLGAARIRRLDGAAPARHRRVYRWSRILTGRVPIRDFRADRIEGDDWYKRAMRAHANCVENLPVFGAIVLALRASGIDSPTASAVSAVISPRASPSPGPRELRPDERRGLRPLLVLRVQIAGFVWLIAIVVAHAANR